MARTATPETTAADLPTITAIDPASIPVSARQSVISDAERAYIDTLTTTLANGGASAGPFADSKAASASMAKVKRLLKRVSPTFPGDGKAVRWSTGASGTEFAWFAKIGEPSNAGKPKNGTDS